MRIFDANIRLGRLAASRGSFFATAEELLSTMDEFGIARALVYSALARESDHVRGNSWLDAGTEGFSRLLRCWVTVPQRENPADLVDRMNKSGVRVLRLFPTSGHYAIRPWCLRGLAEALLGERKILFLDFEGTSWLQDGIDWEGIYQVCTEWPALNVVVCGATMASPANYRGFIRSCENLHLEISQLISPGEITRMVADGMASRLVFGSDMPTRHLGAPLAMLGLEEIDDRSRRMILHDNLAGLLGPLEALEGETPSRNIPRFSGAVDTHVHLGGWNHSCAGSGTAEDTVRDMDRCGIKTIIATSLWSCFGEVALGNAYVAQAALDFPDRILGYLTLDPKHPGEVQEQIRLHGGNRAFRGIKLHGSTHAVPLQDPRCAEILHYANGCKIPLLIHGNIDPPLWEDICRRYPEATFIVAHVGGCGPDCGPALELARLCRRVKNLYFDLASSRNFFGFLEELADLAGPDKILYGSDYPLMDFGFELGQILFCRLSETDKQMILSGNARRIFDLGTPVG